MTFPDRDSLPARRAVLCGAGIACVTGLTACGGGGATTATKAASSAASSASGTSIDVGDTAIGGGVVKGQVVVVRTAKDEYKAYSAICTHQQCVVARVESSTVFCDCHGSQFDGATGKPTQGPATAPLVPLDVTVTDGTATVA
ncbi:MULTISPECIES: ubiquinol-cytochrome c reductase iron-sulfur subunit [unclassified Janibacter]|uniref:QcrA and Rieske domain-containing protein n=1 Tax=unclassified Janibacter TaxID=2649294 RepID=UPI003D044D62